MDDHPTGQAVWSAPRVRSRRMRRSAAIRQLVAETRLHPANLVLPPVGDATSLSPPARKSWVITTVAASRNSVSSASGGDKWPLATMTADHMCGIVGCVTGNSIQGQKTAVCAG
jgi:hypothetical protein